MLIGFSSGKGAPGASLAVANIGVALARAGQSVLAVDLDPGGGVLSAYLGGVPTAGLWPLIRSGQQASRASLLKQVQVLHGLPLIAGFPRGSDAAGIDLAAIARTAGGLAETVLVDAGRLPGDGAPVLEVCQRIVLVVRADPVGILAAEQALVALAPATLRWVYLLVSGSSDAQELREVRELLGAPVLGAIPWEPDEIRRRRADQRPLTGRAGKAFGRVAETFMPSTQPAQARRARTEGVMADGA